MNRNFMQVMKNNKKGMELVQVGIVSLVKPSEWLKSKDFKI